MAESRWKYRPPEAGILHLRESVRHSLLALVPSGVADARLDVSLVEHVERALRCELPDEVLACFVNGDSKLPEWGFNLGEVADHTAWARELGCRRDLIAIGRHPDSHALYCVSRRGDRQRPVGLTEFEVEAQDMHWYDLGAWLAELTGLEPDVCSTQPSEFVQLSLFPDLKPDMPSSRSWLLS